MRSLIERGVAARAAIGVYLAVHYALIVPFAAEIYGRSGTLPDARLNPIVVPGASLIDHVATPPVFVGAMVVLACLLAFGIGTRACAALLWLGGMALFHRNQLTLNPAMPFLGLWLVSQVVERRSDVRDVTRILWTVAAAAYGYSGLCKLLSPAWASGEAVPLILAGPLGRGGLTDALAILPAWIGRALTFSALAVELAYVPLAFVPRARPWLWLATMLLHAGLVATVSIADISLGMMAFHVALFDASWLPARSQRPGYRIGAPALPVRSAT